MAEGADEDGHRDYRKSAKEHSQSVAMSKDDSDIGFDLLTHVTTLPTDCDCLPAVRSPVDYFNSLGQESGHVWREGSEG